MRSRLTRSINLASFSHGDNWDQDGQEVLGHPDGDDCDIEEDKQSPSGGQGEGGG